MIEVIIVGEGVTEETFIRDVLAPTLTAHDISLQPRLIATSKEAVGGALTPERVLRYLRNTLRERDDTYITTLFDLYGLRPDFPGAAAARKERDPIRRCRAIEREFAQTAVEVSGCREDRFIAHIQPYEFEALLFSMSAASRPRDPSSASYLSCGTRAAARTVPSTSTTGRTPTPRRGSSSCSRHTTRCCTAAPSLSASASNAFVPSARTSTHGCGISKVCAHFGDVDRPPLA